MSNSNAQISGERQGLYYGGMALTIVGLLMFLSVFLSGISSFNGARGNSERPVVWVSPGSEDVSQFRGPLGIPENAEIRTGPPGSGPSVGSSPSGGSGLPNPLTALCGMGLIVVGGIMMSVGRAGLRGSGIVLDPQGAREDLKPWSHAAGGMLDDTLSASPLVNRALQNAASDAPRNEPQIRVRCGNCRALNDEDAKFCDECGAKL